MVARQQQSERLGLLLGGYAFGPDARTHAFPDVVSTTWAAGSIQNVAWGIVANVSCVSCPQEHAYTKRYRTCHCFPHPASRRAAAAAAADARFMRAYVWIGVHS